MPEPGFADPVMLRSKTAIRAEFRERRRRLPAVSAVQAGVAAAGALAAMDEFRAARSVAAYLSAENEVDTAAAIQAAHDAGKQIYLPRISKPAGLVRWSVGDELRLLASGVSEPCAGEPEILSCPCIVLVPVVAWSDDGTRVGRGGGFYDRLLAQLPADGTVRVGMAFEWQQVAELPREVWDVPLDYVLTESRVIACSATAHFETRKGVAIR